MDSDELFEMSIEELMELPVEVSGSLTGSTRRLNPSTVTTLTKEDIRSSGARDIDELLDIYIPNFQRMHEYWEFRKNGLRGINSDRDDKYLILVNGRVMNEHTHYGAISERDLPTLTDINHIDVIRGPGSALYGPGAIAMVINIVTENAMTYEGTESTARVGVHEEFYSLEFKHGKKLSEESGYFLFAGISKYLGADEGDTPIELGHKDPMYPPLDGQPRLHQAWRDQPKYKLHAEYTHGTFDAWIRYTKGGEYHAKPSFFLEEWRDQGDGYQQLTLFAGYTHEINLDLSIDYSLSFDIFDFEKAVYNKMLSHREDEWTGRILAKWNPSDDHHLAFGGEFSYEKFGKKSPGYPHEPPEEWTFWAYGVDLPHWKSRMYSLLSEYQWRMSEEWTAFLGGRFDYHSFTKDMYSPRATLVYTPSELDTAKLIYARSVRTGQAADLKFTDVTSDKDTTDPEKIDAFELRYERQQTENLWLAGSAFYHYHDLTGYNFLLGYTTMLGNLETWGLEAEMIYKSENTRIIFSQAYTKLIDWDPKEPSVDVISSQPFGYGDDLTNWSNHQTKLSVQQDLTDELTFDGSIRVYWGYPGFKDYVRYIDDYYGLVPRATESQFRPSFFLNLGLDYDVSENLNVRLDGHDLLGFFDDDVNERLYGFYLEGDTRALAPSLSITATYRF